MNPDNLGQGITMSKELHAKITRAYEEYNQWSVTQKCELVLCCKVEKVFQKGQKKVTFAFRDPAFRQMMLEAFEGLQGLTLKQGRAPPTFMERELQTMLEQMEAA